jgi:hypothetical protein
MKKSVFLLLNVLLCFGLLSSNVSAHQAVNTSTISDRVFASMVVVQLEKVLDYDLQTNFSPEQGWEVFYQQLVAEVVVGDALVEAEVFVKAQNRATARAVAIAQNMAERTTNDQLVADLLSVTVNTAADRLISVVEEELLVDLLCEYELVTIGTVSVWIDPIKMIGSINP